MLINQTETVARWDYMGENVEIEKYHLIEAKDFEEEKLILIIYEMKDSDYPCLAGYNYDGSIRFEVRSSDELGISRFTAQQGINIPIVGWIKENDEYNDYFFSVNPKNGTLSKQSRAY